MSHTKNLFSPLSGIVQEPNPPWWWWWLMIMTTLMICLIFPTTWQFILLCCYDFLNIHKCFKFCGLIQINANITYLFLVILYGLSELHCEIRAGGGDWIIMLKLAGVTHALCKKERWEKRRLVRDGEEVVLFKCPFMMPVVQQANHNTNKTRSYSVLITTFFFPASNTD